jgi:GTP-binding protein HflX
VKDILDQKRDAETTVLVGIVSQNQTEEQTKEYLDELAFLAETAGVEVKKSFTQKLDTPNPKTFIGTGKLNEIQAYMEEHEIEMIIFDDELSPSQIRNIEKVIKGRAIDQDEPNIWIFLRNVPKPLMRKFRLN